MERKRYPEKPLLLVDDEEDVLLSYKKIFKINKINNLIMCTSGCYAIELLQNRDVSAILLDLSMPKMPGNEVLQVVKQSWPGIPVIIVTGSNRVETAVECMKNGALDYMVKPVEESRLLSGIRNALELCNLQHENHALIKQILSAKSPQQDFFSSIITVNDKMRSLFNYIEAVAPLGRSILITGESGVGKELVADAIHRASGRKGKFVPVNVGGLDDSMFSDTLFGHCKGAYTGANTERQGLVEQATEGTLFLDEIGTIDKASQVKLLRLLQENEYYRLGSDFHSTANTTIIAATNDDLSKLIKNDVFRSDLYFRLSTHQIRIPPLRERSDDIPHLVDFFCNSICTLINRSICRLSKEAYALLGRYQYPGNVRELQSMLFDAISRTSSDIIEKVFFEGYIQMQMQVFGENLLNTRTHSPSIIYAGGFPTMSEIQDFFINKAMEKANGNQTVAAKLLDISQSTLSKRARRKMTGTN